MKCEELIEILQRQSPENLACEWDNVGLLIGDRNREVKSVYIALDATDLVIEEAVSHGADMLITHHPMIFSGEKRIVMDDFMGRRIIKLIRADISYYAMHTNYDVAGMAELSGEMMQLRDAAPLEVTTQIDGVPQGIGRVGRLDGSMSVTECAYRVKQLFDIQAVRIFGDIGRRVQRVAISPGSGKSEVQNAIEAGAELLITGDIDHHTGIDAVAQGLSIIDAGHYGLEHIFVPYMEQYIAKEAPDMKIYTRKHIEPYVTI